MRPSEYRQSEAGGLYLPLSARLKGRVKWQVLDERGVPEIPRSPTGFALGPLEGVAQDNLITNLGLDRIADLNVFDSNPGSTQAWRRRLAVGTGSTAPAVSDTTLANEVQRAATSGTFPNGSLVGELDTTANVWRATSLVTRLVTMTADRNLTEFGFAQNTTGDIVIRELLRDGSGTPVTVSLLSGKILKVDHTLTVELPAPAFGHAHALNIEEYDAGNNLQNTIPLNIVRGLRVPSATSANIVNELTTGNDSITVFHIWNPCTAAGTGVRRLTQTLSYDRVMSIAVSNLDPSGATGPAMANLGLVGYTNGSYTRIKRAIVASGSGNAPWHGFYLGASGPGSQAHTRSAFIVVFNSTYTKRATDTLTVGIVSSWARA